MNTFLTINYGTTEQLPLSSYPLHEKLLIDRFLFKKKQINKSTPSPYEREGEHARERERLIML